MISFKQYMESRPWKYEPPPGAQQALAAWVEQNASAIQGKRIHMSYEGVPEVSDSPQILPPDHYRMNGKPFGLWYALGREWIDFILREMSSGIVDYIYEIVVNPARLLVVKEQQIVDKLDKEFGVWSDFKKHGWYSDDGIQRVGHSPSGKVTEHPKLLNWEEMRKHYDGIEVYPMHIDAAWAREWAVDSGCIWNKTGVSEIRLLAQFKNGSYQ